MMRVFILRAPLQKNLVRFRSHYQAYNISHTICHIANPVLRWASDHGHGGGGGHRGGEEDAPCHHAGLHDHHPGACYLEVKIAIVAVSHQIFRTVFRIDTIEGLC